MALIMRNAESIVGALKNTQAITKAINVINQEPLLTSNDEYLFARTNLGFIARQTWLITKYIPCITHQMTNVHPAPCHNHPSNIVTIKFIYRRLIPFRFPPNGI